MNTAAVQQVINTAPVPRRDAEPARPAVARYGAAFWWIAFVFVTGMAFSTVPTPLYPLYQVRDGFSTFTITIVFAAYTIGVLTSLALAGHLSDLVGRRKVLLAALALELAAAVLFLAEPPLLVLLLARLLTGLGVGMLTPTATAHLQELHQASRPGASPQRFEIVSTAANIGGLGVGPLIAGVLAQYVTTPLRLPYLVFGLLLLISMTAVALAPETIEQRTSLLAYRGGAPDHNRRARHGRLRRRGRRGRCILRRLRIVHITRTGVRRWHPARLLPGAGRSDRIHRLRRGRGGTDPHQPT
jgi:MFS family permease